MTPRIGFIGLGIMGSHMAGHLCRAGYSLVVHDIMEDAVQRLVDQGAARVGSPAMWALLRMSSSPCCLTLRKCEPWRSDKMGSSPPHGPA